MSEDYIQLPPDGTGKKVRAIRRPDNRYEEVMVLFSKDGTVDLKALYDLTSKLSTEGTLSNVKTLLDKLEDALASVGDDKFRTSIVDPLPAGTNKIGSVDVDNFPAEYPLPSTQIADLKNVTVKREGAVTHIEVTFTTAGSQTVYTPSTGKKAKVIGFFLKCDSDVDWELRFKTTLSFIAGLPLKGAVAMNGMGMEMPTGAIDEPVEIYVDGACTIKGWINVKEIS